jgi:hypothetical protein
LLNAYNFGDELTNALYTYDYQLLFDGDFLKRRK